MFRICDVVPRGFSGYNTRWCKIIMPKVFGHFKSNEIACVTILLGSNDSVPEMSTGQHVPVNEYKTNLQGMISYLESIGISNNKIILMTPPCFDLDAWNRCCVANNRGKIPENWKGEIEKYVIGCRTVAKQNNISLVDLFPLFTSVKDNKKLFSDGLHLSQEGAQLLYENLLPVIEEKVAEFIQKPIDEKALQYPYWMNVDSKNPEKSFCS